MSTTFTPTQRIHRPVPRAQAHPDFPQPWVHHGVASERARRAYRGWKAELLHAEHHATRARAATIGGSR